jgi:anti-sigma factor RsiW
VTCLEVRDRLTEHSLGVLSKADAREVERHLEWCPGCRKEASELSEGAASMSLALPVADPPTSLEGRILERFRMAAGRTPVPHRGRLRVMVVAAVVAAIAVSGTTGWVIAKKGTETLHEKVAEAVARSDDFAKLANSFRGNGRVFTGTLMAPVGDQGFGQAIVFSAPKEGFVLVDIPVLPQRGGPFSLQLVGKGVIDAGQINPANSDHPVILKWFTDEPLSKMTTVTVIDQSNGAVVLTGKLVPYTTPSA